jgi:hypothetical protein
MPQEILVDQVVAVWLQLQVLRRRHTLHIILLHTDLLAVQALLVKDILVLTRLIVIAVVAVVAQVVQGGVLVLVVLP